MEEADPRAKLEPLQALNGEWTMEMTHPMVDAVVVEVNSDISSGKCPKGVPITKEWTRSISCRLPADRIFEALAETLGKPSPSPPE
jgi:hypothetical protein